ncbi:hypothetical protein Taro_003894, partial [Colocasia esculenta]|nr:hypothetical protein [Colocasia esculenta]
ATGGSFRRSTATGGESERWGKLLQRRVAVYINLEPGARRSWRLLGTAQGELPQPFQSPWRFFQRQHMASRGRRGGVPAREGEQRREEQTEQQAPAPQGPVLPPPPPVDYGVFMQGLVQAMQTQAHTQAALQAQLEAQRTQVPVPQAQDHGGPSIMERFKRIFPPSFKGECDPLLAKSWMWEIEKVFRTVRCADEDKVTLATYMLQKRPAAPFQRQDKKKAVYQSPQRPVVASSTQVPSQHSPGVKKECPHCGRAHGGTECWMVAGKCLKCGSSDHKIKDCSRLQQGVQHGAPAPAAVAAAPPTTRRLGMP